MLRHAAVVGNTVSTKYKEEIENFSKFKLSMNKRDSVETRHHVVY